MAERRGVGTKGPGAGGRDGGRRARFARTGLVAALAAVAPACTAGMHTQVEEPLAPARVSVATRLAVLPVTTEAGSEGIRPELTRRVLEALGAALPGVRILPPDEVARRLAASGSATEWADLVGDYERAGTVDGRRVARVAEAVGARHLLQLRGAYLHERFLDPVLFEDEVTEEDRQLLEVVVRLWEEGGTEPLWEAVLRTRSETDDFVWSRRGRGELLEQIAERLAERIPLAGPASGWAGPAPEPR